jgi:hypothetical protein
MYGTIGKPKGIEGRLEASQCPVQTDWTGPHSAQDARMSQNHPNPKQVSLQRQTIDYSCPSQEAEYFHSLNLLYKDRNPHVGDSRCLYAQAPWWGIS